MEATSNKREHYRDPWRERNSLLVRRRRQVPRLNRTVRTIRIALRSQHVAPQPREIFAKENVDQAAEKHMLVHADDFGARYRFR